MSPAAFCGVSGLQVTLFVERKRQTTRRLDVSRARLWSVCFVQSCVDFPPAAKLALLWPASQPASALGFAALHALNGRVMWTGDARDGGLIRSPLSWRQSPPPLSPSKQLDLLPI